MKLFFPEELERYADAHTTRPTEFLEELERETKKCVPMSQMLTGRVEGTLLRMLVRISGAKKVVDVGTYTGYSALMMAEGLPPDGEIITCEISEDHAELALRFIARSPRANHGETHDDVAARVHDVAGLFINGGSGHRGSQFIGAVVRIFARVWYDKIGGMPEEGHRLFT
ncbi:MAG: hypothetical protein P8Y77_07125 [Nitrospirota bacterium]